MPSQILLIIRIEPQWNVNWKEKYSNTNVLELEQNHSGM